MEIKKKRRKKQTLSTTTKLAPFKGYLFLLVSIAKEDKGSIKSKRAQGTKEKQSLFVIFSTALSTENNFLCSFSFQKKKVWRVEKEKKKTNTMDFGYTGKKREKKRECS